MDHFDCDAHRIDGLEGKHRPTTLDKIKNLLLEVHPCAVEDLISSNEAFSPPPSLRSRQPEDSYRLLLRLSMEIWIRYRKHTLRIWTWYASKFMLPDDQVCEPN